ncbi:histidine phosphotransferase family protein [Rhodovibrionaceae bacterium A322]
MSELLVAELLASRLCHDLVGPVSAINNGMELLEEDFGMEDEAKGLVSGSAQQASAVLQFFRMAYGASGAVGSELQQVKDLAEKFCSYRKEDLEWHSDGVAMLPDNLGKLLLNMISLASESLPRGGSLVVRMQQLETGFEVTATAIGREVGLREETLSGLEPSVAVEDLTPRSVHAYFLRQLVKRMGGDFSLITSEPGQLAIKVLLA